MRKSLGGGTTRRATGEGWQGSMRVLDKLARISVEAKQQPKGGTSLPGEVVAM